MKNPGKLIIIGLMAVIALVGCRGENPVEDLLAPEIKILKPKNGTSFQAGDSIMVAVIVTENDQLHDVNIFIRDLRTNLKVFSRHIHEHRKTVEFAEAFLPDSPVGTSYVLEVVAEDHHGWQASQNRTFTFTP